MPSDKPITTKAEKLARVDNLIDSILSPIMRRHALGVEQGRIAARKAARELYKYLEEQL